MIFAFAKFYFIFPGCFILQRMMIWHYQGNKTKDARETKEDSGRCIFLKTSSNRNAVERSVWLKKESNLKKKYWISQLCFIIHL